MVREGAGDGRYRYQRDPRYRPCRRRRGYGRRRRRHGQKRAARRAGAWHRAARIWEANLVNPPSRRAEPPGRPGHHGHSGPPKARPTAAGTSASPPNALFAEMLRAARELLAVRSPLDAELMVSELLGTWWGQRALLPGTRPSRRRRADVEELVGEGLIAYAAQQGSPAALALLSGIACLGTPRQAASAEQAGAVVAAECYMNSDAYGDRDEVVCVFSYAGQEQHALVVVVDYNAGGMARDGWVTSQVDKLLDYCRQSASTFTQVQSPHARRLLE